MTATTALAAPAAPATPGLFEDQAQALHAANAAPGMAMAVTGTLTQAAQVRVELDAHGHTRHCLHLVLAVDGPGQHVVTADVPCASHHDAERRAHGLPKGHRVAVHHPPQGLRLHMPHAALSAAVPA